MKTAEVVHFRDSEELPEDVIKEIREKGIKYGLDDIIPFSTEEIAVAEWVKPNTDMYNNHYLTEIVWLIKV